VRLLRVGRNGTSVICQKNRVASGHGREDHDENAAKNLSMPTLHYYGCVVSGQATRGGSFMGGSGDGSFSFRMIGTDCLPHTGLPRLHTSVPKLIVSRTAGSITTNPA